LLVGRLQLRDVKDRHRSDFADARGVVAVRPRQAEDGFLVKVVAAVVIVEVRKNLIVLDEWRQRAGCLAKIAGVECGVPRINRVAEVAGVSEQMAGGHHRSVGRGEGREDTVAIYEVNAELAEFKKRRRVGSIHRTVTETVADEDNCVSFAGLCRFLRQRLRGGRLTKTGSKRDAKRQTHNEFP